MGGAASQFLAPSLPDSSLLLLCSLVLRARLSRRQKPPQRPPHRACSVLGRALTTARQRRAPGARQRRAGPFKSGRPVARQRRGPRWRCTAEALPRPGPAGSRWPAPNPGHLPAAGGRLQGRGAGAHWTPPTAPVQSGEGEQQQPTEDLGLQELNWKRCL